MEQWKAILATLMIFGSGVGTGHLLTRQPTPETPVTPQAPGPKFQPQTSHPSPTRSARPVFFRSSGYLDRHLQLSEEQKDQIQELTKQSYKRISEFGKPFRDQLREEHRELQQQIRNVLTPDQVRTYDNLPHFRFNKEAGRPIGRPPHHGPPHQGLPHPFQKKPVSPKPESNPDKVDQSGRSFPGLKNA